MSFACPTVIKNRKLIITGVLWMVFCQIQIASAEINSEILYREAKEKFDAQSYEDAKGLLEDAITVTPGVSRYHHLLGKCYGRMAEQASALLALSLARKTRFHFEKAVELDNENIPALKDLMEYYLQAPGFLGGSRKKAGEIEKKISRLNTQIPGEDNKLPEHKETDPAVM